MYSLQYRSQKDHTHIQKMRGWWPKAAAPSFSGYWVWSICGLYCRLYTAYVQLMYGPYMAYACLIYGRLGLESWSWFQR